MPSLLQYCPACGGQPFAANSPKSFLCSPCNFLLYLNAAAAVAGILESGGDILLTVRGNAPSVGMFDLPGGFVDHGETIEAALVRELREELGVDILAVMGDRPPNSPPPPTPETLLSPCYVGSSPNIYPYRGVTYQTVDLFYRLSLPHKPDLRAEDEVIDVVWVPQHRIPFDQIAFPSVRDMLARCYAA